MKPIIHVARSWRSFGPQQIVAVHSLVNAFSNSTIHFHIVINELPEHKVLEEMKSCLPNNATFGLYTEEILDEYARQNGATQKHIENFKTWKWIYHLLLYHALYNEEKIEYLLSYDDDIFFQRDVSLAEQLAVRGIPFSIQDLYTDGDKALMPQLIEYFGPWIHENYYSSSNNGYSSNSGFMGIQAKAIFSQFPRGESFVKMLEMFTYRPYEHGKPGLQWKDYKILLQEQSFLGILNRSLVATHFVLNDKEHGYSVEHIDKSPVQHYVAEKKYEKDFTERVDREFEKIKENVRNTRS